MLKLNLVYQDKSDITFKRLNFPDGQNQINIVNNFNLQKPITIYSRLNNFLNLEEIICATKSLRNLGVKEIHLYTPYFLGSRSDRQFEEGSNNYLKDVICPILNSLNLDSITCIDPHSHVLEALLNNFRRIDNQELVKWSLEMLQKDNGGKWHDNFVLVSPDAGASHKIYKLAEAIGYKGDIITCSKERDAEGNLTQTVVPLSGIGNKDFIIIDDICDGGRTFINIVKEIKKGPFDGKIYLIVTHGIFSAGFKELAQYFNGIYCTNSYSDIGDKAMINGELQTTNVHQLNIF